MMSSVAADGRCGFMFIMALTPPCQAARLEADLSSVFLCFCVSVFFVSLSCVECALNVYYGFDTPSLPGRMEADQCVLPV